MGFISFNESWYRQKLRKFEHRALSADELYEVRQLLKVLDDLTDEGYTNLNDTMERDFACLTRLRAILHENGAEPFPMEKEPMPGNLWSTEEYELSAMTDALCLEAAHAIPSRNPFLREIRAYCDWIGYEEDTAYVFLFRDALLPYVYFKGRGGKHLYPWLISRRFLCDLAQIPDVDDDFRLPVYMALEQGEIAFDDFRRFFRREAQSVFEKYPAVTEVLSALLRSVPEEKIVVVESGYCGTVPLMLSALDERVTFRFYTTAPYLYETYREVAFCRRYEDIRRFETVYSQDLLLHYASFRDGRFFVNRAEERSITERALGEIRCFLP